MGLTGSPITDLDLRIVAELERAHGEGSILTGDLADVLDVSVQAVSARLRIQRKRGWVHRHKVDGRWVAWSLVEDAFRTQPWRQS